MNTKFILSLLFILLSLAARSQSEAYQKQKAEKIAEGSVFTRIIQKEAPADIVYEDEDIIVFKPLRLQAPVHLLIVPKKEIPTINDIQEADAMVLGKLFLVAKQLAKENGIAESGYRLVMNTNEDAGQSVFHLHMHLLGGQTLGPMVRQSEKKDK